MLQDAQHAQPQPRPEAVIAEDVIRATPYNLLWAKCAKADVGSERCIIVCAGQRRRDLDHASLPALGDRAYVSVDSYRNLGQFLEIKITMNATSELSLEFTIPLQLYLGCVCVSLRSRASCRR